MKSELRNRLTEGAAAVGVHLSPAQAEQLLALADLLLDWNTRVNLTAIRDLRGVVDRHLVDSLAVVPHLVPGSLVDVGAGAGFPGLPIALVRPDVSVTLLESIHKKSAFTRSVILTLAIPATACTARLEDWARDAPRQANAVSRATFAPLEWLRRGAPLLGPGGVLMAMTTPAEPDPLPPGGSTFERHHYSLPDGTPRVLWRLRFT